MATQLHTYTANVRWKGAREGEGDVRNGGSGQGYDLRVPPEFGGPGGALNPEELLTDAITGCYAITFGIVAANRKLPVVEVQVESLGTVEQNGASFVYKSIVLNPTIVVSDDATDEQIAAAADSAHKADAYCIVTNAVRGKVEVTIKPSVERQRKDDGMPDPAPTPDTLPENRPSGETSSPSVSSSAPVSGDTLPGDGAGNEAAREGATDGGYAAGGLPDDGIEVADKPGSATPSTASSAASDASAGDVPKNADVSGRVESSEEAGDPERMQVGAVPG